MGVQNQCGIFSRLPITDKTRFFEGGKRLHKVSHTSISTKNIPKISIITVVFNNTKTLERCIQSVLNQSFSNLEYIIIDGGSDQATIDIIKKYEKQIDYYISEKDSGIYNAMNKGIRCASGDYIELLNSDDYLFEDAISSIADNIEIDNPQVIYGNALYYNSDGTILCSSKKLGMTDDGLLKGQSINHQATFVPKEIYNKYGLYSEEFKLGADSRFFANLKINNVTFKHVDTDIVHFYLGGASAESGLEVDLDAIDFLDKNNIPYAIRIHWIICFLLIHKDQIERLLSWGVNYINGFRKNLLELRRIYDNGGFPPPYGHSDHHSEMLDVLIILFGLPLGDDQFSKVFKPEILGRLSNNWFRKTIGLIKASYKYYSFDLFDTLIVRPAITPSDLFKLMDTEAKSILGDSFFNFSKFRKTIEKEVRESCSKEEISLDEIYEYATKLTGFDKSLWDKIKEKEIELEVEMLEPRVSGLALWESLRNAGKQLIITSDIYLDQSVVAKILENNLITGFNKIYLSSVLLKTKHTGNLFYYVLEDLSINPSELVHIGDNEYSDIKVPNSLGISTLHYVKTSDLFIKNTNYGKLLKKHDGFDFNFALICNYFFDDPFVDFDRNSFFNNDLSFFGQIVFGPFLFSLTRWIIKQYKKNKNDKILLFARDGYLIEKALDIISRKDVNYQYTYISRNSANPLLLNFPWRLIKKLKVFIFDDLSIADFISQRIGEEFVPFFQDALFKKNIAIDDKAIKYRDVIIQLFADNFSHIQKVNIKNKDFVLSYFKNIIGKSCNVAIYDAGMHGSLQEALSIYFGDIKNGYYILTEENIRTKNPKSSYLSFYGDFSEDSIRHHIPIIWFEVFLSDTSPSCKGYRDNKPIFDVDRNSKKFKNNVAIVQKSILDFVNRMKHKFLKYADDVQLSGPQSLQILELYLASKNKKDRKIFEVFTQKDPYSTSNECGVLDYSKDIPFDFLPSTFFNKKDCIHLNTTNSGGAGFAANRLVEALNKIDVTTDFCVIVDRNNQSHGSQLTLGSNHLYRKNAPHVQGIFNKYIFGRNTYFSSSYPSLDFKILDEIIAHYRIINIHWISEMLSVEALSYLTHSEVPIVWTLHDKYAFTGGCHCFHGCEKWRTDCKYCPQLTENLNNYPNKIFNLKKSLINFNNITLVVLNNHFKNIVESSPLFSSCRVEIIPNSLDLKVFKPGTNTLKNDLKINSDDKIVLYCADYGSTIKGYEEFEETLKFFYENHSDTPIIILLAGRLPGKEKQFKSPFIELGYLDLDQLIKVYQISDVTVIPSTEDNLPNIMLESLACGTPVVGFNVGGLPDIIKDGINGYTVEIGDCAALSEKIYNVLISNLRDNCRKSAEKHFDPAIQARKYKNLYQELLSGKVKLDNPNSLLSQEVDESMVNELCRIKESELKTIDEPCWIKRDYPKSFIQTVRKDYPIRLDKLLRCSRVLDETYGSKLVQILKIRHSGLFLYKFYLTQYKSGKNMDIDPVVHYVLYGASEGLFPNPLFDSEWYLTKYPEVKKEGFNPLYHYIMWGGGQNYDPHPDFSTTEYLRANPDVTDSGMNPLSHYLHIGAVQGRPLR